MMFQWLLRAVRPSKGRSLASALSRLGWTGFWLQVVLGSIPILVMIYYFLFSRSENVRVSNIPFVEYLTIINLVLLLFTIYWSYRYTRVARKLRDVDPARRPSEASVIGTVWTGVVASAASMLFSMIVILIDAASLLFFFLKAPQGGMAVIQTAGAESQYWVSSVDMVSLMALILTLFAELMVLVFSLWLLFQATHGAPELPPTTEK
jgi:hypothetical protein